MPQTGTFILLLHLPENTSLNLENWGRLDFPAGFYTYAGGAFGPDGLAGRIKHYLTSPEHPQESLDYLRQVANLEEIWLAAGPTTREHAWANLLAAIPGGVILIDGFGADDCDCDSHLCYFDIRPTLADFEVDARHLFPEDILVRAFNRGEDDDTPANP